MVGSRVLLTRTPTTRRSAEGSEMINDHFTVGQIIQYALIGVCVCVPGRGEFSDNSLNENQ